MDVYNEMEILASEVDSISDEIKKVNAIIRELRNDKKEKEQQIYKFMDEYDIKEYKQYNQQHKDKPRKKRLTKKEREQRDTNIIRFFESLGANNPRELYTEFKAISK